jgi:hypothetical protein
MPVWLDSNRHARLRKRRLPLAMSIASGTAAETLSMTARSTA